MLLLCAGTGRTAPISLAPSNAINSAGRTVRIFMTGSNGVQYFVRGSTDLTNWPLMQTNGIAGTGSTAELNVPIATNMSTRGFFRIESNFEQRARLFISNYQRQLENGGPATLSVNGTNVQSTITLTQDTTNNQIVITGNGVPNYTPTILGLNVTDGWNTPVAGGFQSLKFSENNYGASGGNNPNRLLVATETFRIPLNPVNNATATDTALGTVGVAVNGIPIYNPFEDANQTAATGRIFSGCCGHPQLTGVYHYHKYPTCLRLLKGDIWQSEKEKCDEIDALVASGGHSPLIGFALDGWPVYGPVGWKDTNRVSKLLKSSYTGASDAYGNPSYVIASGDLDDCNGLVSPTPEYPEGIYHYVMSLEANSDGTAKREISPYFGYDVRNTLKKHGLMPSGWTNDTTYVNALKAGFTLGAVSVPGTDSSSFSTYYQFVTNLIAIMNANGMSAVAEEFQAMKISYPFTIRKYRGTPSNATGGGATGNGGVTAISPSSGTRGQSYFVTITLQAVTGTPGLPPTSAPITTATVGGIALTSPTRASTTTVTGTLTLPSGTATGAKDIVVTFQGPAGQPAPTYTATGLFTITAPTHSDSAAGYSAWTSGSTGGTGFGAWTLSTSGSAATYLAGPSDANMNVGATSGFGLWADTGGTASASRTITNPLGNGDNFSIRFDNNWVSTGGQVGLSFADSLGNVRLRFYFVGGESTYRVSDATPGRSTAIPWTDAGLTVSFTQTSLTSYSLAVGTTIVTGTLATGGAISRFAVDSSGAGPNGNYNLYFGEITLTDVP